MSDCRCVIAARAALELEDGQVTNLGAGIPMLVANYIPEHIDVIIQAENGILGVGPVSAPGTQDPDRRNAGNLYVTLLPGGCYFDTATSFAMIRGGRVAATMLGTLQVDGDGNIANYEMPGRKIGMGGAMDLVAGARTVYAICVQAAISSSVWPQATSSSTKPRSGCRRNKARSVMMTSHSPAPVSGSVQRRTSLGAPSLVQCSVSTYTVRAPATRSMAPPMPILRPGIS